MAPSSSARSRRWLLSLAVVALACCSSLLLPLVVRGDTLDAQIYTAYVNQGYCVRLASQLGVHGCSLPVGGLHGHIRAANDLTSLEALAASSPSYRVALLMPHEMLTPTALDIIARLDMAGIMLLPSTSDAVTNAAFSAGPRTPQLLPFIPSSTSIPDRPSSQPLFNNSYEWNPTGQDLLLKAFNYAIVTVTTAEVSYLTSLANTNEANADAGKYVYHRAHFDYHMYAKTDTPKCLEDTTCLPVGGYSVWGSLGNLTSNSTESPADPATLRPFLLLTTKMDATAFFHQMTPGGDESQASVAVLAAAVKVLSNTTGVGRLPIQILFAVFQGEDYSHVGSRKFVDDLQNFQCTELNAKYDGTSSTAVCTRPHKNTLDFQDVTVERIEKIVEVGQIGLNATVFLHRQRDGLAATDAMIQTVYGVAANMSSPLSVELAADDTPGIPPACAEAFLEARSTIATLVVTDHAGPFANKAYQSDLDGALNMLTESTPGSTAIRHAGLCAKATLIARTVWIEAGGDVATSSTIEADCTLIDAMLNCMLEDTTCALLKEIAPYAFTSNTADFKAPPHYTSVYNLLTEVYISDMPFFLYNLFGSWILNATDWRPAPAGATSWPAAPRNIHFHDAVDPNLVFDLDANRWRIKPTANDRLLYTESNWASDVAWRTYRTEDERIQITTLVLGIAIAAATILSVAAMQRYCRRRFKKL